MSRNYKFDDQERPYFVTFTVVRWIDVFTRREYKDILVESLKFCIEKKGLQLYAWVIMSNHVHLIIGTKDKPMGSILRDIKRHTSKALTKAISENVLESRREWMLWFFEREGKQNPNNEQYQFWQQDESHPIELWSSEVMDQKLDYIHYNPVVAGWVDEPEHYLYSSARDYAGGKGLIDIILMV
ncbi:REP-associated tyrosine transposase [Mucilaginibacter gotjawali]|uniref:REP element-mobilizing transposase RayT n=2 Tax=Mucilaginibacter gotjawali TaxID=1550579 RepID=A0A839SJ97_9SPHI|nr:transposase [Mucilaginibacter gotjawali]MBB3057906.1 REP element-mobilizing transposase RayT [Mucilaginibacter gotjawali]BAU52322.1 Transposase IS200 like protein [Mucilaginibacter gotjawali]